MQASQILSIEVGRRVYTSLYNKGAGTIVAVYGTPNAASVRSLGGIVMTGGSCEVDIAFDSGATSKRLPECILRGVQWKLLDEVVGAEKIAEAVAAAAVRDAQNKARALEVASQFAAACSAAREAGIKLGLTPEAEFTGRGTAAAANLRRELKAAGIKVASLTGDYNSIRVKLADKAQAEAAKAIAAKYKAGSFNGMTDSYEYDPSAWGAVFGDVQFVFVSASEGYLL